MGGSRLVTLDEHVHFQLISRPRGRRLHPRRMLVGGAIPAAVWPRPGRTRSLRGRWDSPQARL